MLETAYAIRTNTAVLQLQPKLGQTVLFDMLEPYILVYYILLVIRFSHVLLVIYCISSFTKQEFTCRINFSKYTTDMCMLKTSSIAVN